MLAMHTPYNSIKDLFIAVFAHMENGQDRFLRKLNVTHLLHALLTIFLLLQQILLTTDVAAVSLG